MVSLQIKGAEQLGDLAKRLRAAGEAGKGLKRELNSSITRATKPLRAKAKQEAKTRLPQSGGLAARVSKVSITARTRTGRDPGVVIQARGDAARSSDRGFVRHPVYGNRDAWVTQRVKPGWFTDTMRGGAREVRKEVLIGMRRVSIRIQKG